MVFQVSSGEIDSLFTYYKICEENIDEKYKHPFWCLVLNQLVMKP